jgi:hypothetical protein
MVTITITGFKTLEEAQKWYEAYEGGVEQDMSNYAEKPISEGSGLSFPVFTKSGGTITTDNNITMELTHPDEYENFQ